MTSNLGSDIILDAKPEDDESIEMKLQQRLQAHFKPEFLNRIDDIVVFSRLDQSLMQTIVEVQLHRVIKRLQESKTITMTVGGSVKEFLAQEGYDPAFGARPLKRLIQTSLLDPLEKESNTIIFSNVDPTDHFLKNNDSYCKYWLTSD